LITHHEDMNELHEHRETISCYIWISFELSILLMISPIPSRVDLMSCIILECPTNALLYYIQHRLVMAVGCTYLACWWWHLQVCNCSAYQTSGGAIFQEIAD
jgi:hypothetical protein